VPDSNASPLGKLTFTVEPYGEFTAHPRDMETDLRITLLADQQIAARGFDPDKASGRSRQWFDLLATFSVTCDSTPPNFDVGKMLRGQTKDGALFLTGYVNALEEAERRFRGDVQEVAEDVPVGGGPEAALQG